VGKKKKDPAARPVWHETNPPKEKEVRPFRGAISHEGVGKQQVLSPIREKRKKTIVSINLEKIGEAKINSLKRGKRGEISGKGREKKEIPRGRRSPGPYFLPRREKRRMEDSLGIRPNREQTG